MLDEARARAAGFRAVGVAVGMGAFCRSVNPISTRVLKQIMPSTLLLAPHGFSDLPKGLLLEKLA